MKELRGFILDFLRKVYPQEVEELNVVGTFYQYYRDRDIRQALAYLVDKGYIERREKRHPVYRRKKLVFYKATAKGIDLLEGTISDDGIILPEED